MFKGKCWFRSQIFSTNTNNSHLNLLLLKLVPSIIKQFKQPRQSRDLVRFNNLEHKASLILKHHRMVVYLIHKRQDLKLIVLYQINNNLRLPLESLAHKPNPFLNQLQNYKSLKSKLRRSKLKRLILNNYPQNNQLKLLNLKI